MHSCNEAAWPLSLCLCLRWCCNTPPAPALFPPSLLLSLTQNPHLRPLNHPSSSSALPLSDPPSPSPCRNRFLQMYILGPSVEVRGQGVWGCRSLYTSPPPPTTCPSHLAMTVQPLLSLFPCRPLLSPHPDDERRLTVWKFRPLLTFADLGLTNTHSSQPQWTWLINPQQCDSSWAQKDSALMKMKQNLICMYACDNYKTKQPFYVIFQYSFTPDITVFMPVFCNFTSWLYCLLLLLQSLLRWISNSFNLMFNHLNIFIHPTNDRDFHV